MRRVLVAAMPFAVLLDGSAQAATTISNAQTTSVATSTAGDVSITAAGSVAVGAGLAVTIDSDNAVVNAGTIQLKDVNGGMGILVLGGHTGSLSNTGSITVNESYAASDSANADAITEAPFASGAGRYGVRLTGTSPFTGSILNSGSVTVQGNGSYGVSLEAPLAGDLNTSGSISLTGDSGSALRELGGVSGAVTVSGSVAAKGLGSTGADLEGDVGGRLAVYSSLTSTGYATTTRPTTAAALSAVQGTATDVEQGGSALIVGGSVGGGVLLGAPPAGTVAGSTADVDADGFSDSGEGTTTVAAYGSAPALVVGGPNRAVSLGLVGGADTENAAQPANAYGLINRGTIGGYGVFDGVSASGLQIGGFSGGVVSIAGGLRNVGVIVGNAYSADASGVSIGANATVPEIRNEGVIQALINASTAANTATALGIAAGAQVSTLTNTGSLLATVTGDKASATAVVDRSGTLSTVLNEGVIGATIARTTAGDTLSGARTALNLSANTTGVTLVQQASPYVGVVYGSTSGSTATATSTATAVVPSIAGDVLLGSGPDSVRLLAGSLTGALDFATGADSLTLDGGASFTGELRYAGSGLALNVANGILRDSNTATVNLTSLNVGAASQLVVAIDPAAGSATRFVVAGPATFAAGATLGFTTKSLLTSPQSFTLVTSPNLSFAAGTAVTSDAPYLFISSVSADPMAGTLTLDVRRRTAAEIGLNPGETAALEPVYAALAGDSAVEAAVFAATDRASFVKLYDRLLPDYSGSVFDLVDQAARQVSDAALSTDVRNVDSGRFWAQQIVLGAQHDAVLAGAYSTTGYGVSGGVEGAQGPLGALGVDATFVTGLARTAGANRVDLYGLQAGFYWRAVYGKLQLGARAGVGYDSLSSERDFAGTDASGTAFARAASAKWNAFQASGRASAAYQFEVGRFFFRPQVHADYTLLDEDGHTETGGGDALDLAVASRSAHDLSATATTAIGWTFGSGGLRWRPEIEAGARDVVEGGAGTTTAKFVSGGDSFSLLSNALQGTGIVARAALTAESDMFRIGLEGSGEERKGRQEGSVLVRVRAAF